MSLIWDTNCKQTFYFLALFPFLVWLLKRPNMRRTVRKKRNKKEGFQTKSTKKPRKAESSGACPLNLPPLRTLNASILKHITQMPCLSPGFSLLFSRNFFFSIPKNKSSIFRPFFPGIFLRVFFIFELFLFSHI